MITQSLLNYVKPAISDLSIKPVQNIPVSKILPDNFEKSQPTNQEYNQKLLLSLLDNPEILIRGFDTPKKANGNYEIGINSKLGQIIPEFREIFNTKQIGHTHTLGKHIALTYKRALSYFDHPEKLADLGFSKPTIKFDEKDKQVLLLATILHDIDKKEEITSKDSNHPLNSAVKAREILTKMSFDKETIDRTCSLVQTHGHYRDSQIPKITELIKNEKDIELWKMLKIADMRSVYSNHNKDSEQSWLPNLNNPRQHKFFHSRHSLRYIKNLEKIYNKIRTSFDKSNISRQNFRGHRFFKVDDKLYRGGQPNEEGIKELAKNGIKLIINLRDPFEQSIESFTTAQEQELAEKSGIKFLNIPATCALFTTPHVNISQEKIDQFLKSIEQSKGPVFVHCKVGQDRTGLTVASYLMRKYNYSFEQAYKYMKTYSHDYILLPELKNYLRDFNAIAN